jgi:hypothetical protein
MLGWAAQLRLICGSTEATVSNPRGQSALATLALATLVLATLVLALATLVLATLVLAPATLVLAPAVLAPAVLAPAVLAPATLALLDNRGTIRSPVRYDPCPRRAIGRSKHAPGERPDSTRRHPQGVHRLSAARQQKTGRLSTEQRPVPRCRGCRWQDTTTCCGFKP